jgi:hypothetical protein
MNRVLLLIAAVVGLGVIYNIVPVVIYTYRRYRGRKTVICPDTGQIAEVDAKALQAGLWSAVGVDRARIKWCSLLPRKKGCEEECLKDNSASWNQTSNNATRARS